MTQPAVTRHQRRQHTRHLALLNTDENALREILHAHVVDPHLRAHAERAVCHVRKAHLAPTDPTRARTVDGLVQDLDRVGRFLARQTSTPSQHT